ncbi:hydroxypyruvate isomerase family protein [Hasllibacter sp. MH4015]|uniref:hydroxypyruvate isomerase family protein n=1 Tax=Hasllibacter sp. MH4015 TaxID=2854029 RepID=UPI001CD64909|nr:TIM barrel protein [Hasllibacter sp. MH4015]
MKFSANLGFLWADCPLPDAIRAAKAAGFDAVECHWPYDTPPDVVRDALSDTGLRMLGLNTARGNVAAGENGMSAVPGRQEEACRAIDEALSYATAIGAGNVHVMAGVASGDAAHLCFIDALQCASNRAARHGITILIEPLNRFDAPGYFLRNLDQAAQIIAEVAVPNLKLMFDCYHVARTEGDVLRHLSNLQPIIGHIQFARVPDRGPPDGGDLDYRKVFAWIEASGWETPLGAEYKPGENTDATLGWLTWARG